MPELRETGFGMQIFGFGKQQKTHLREIIADLHCARLERTLDSVLR